MAQDLRNLFKEDKQPTNKKMSEGHEARFLEKLDEALPIPVSKPNFGFMKIAASVIVLLGLSYGAFQFFNLPLDPKTGTKIVSTTPETDEDLKSLGDISPDLKKIEDYYLANINLELSKVKLTPENKELFDSYLQRLEELNSEYRLLSEELTNDGPSERTVEALIDNLKIRLNLLYRLKEQLKEINDTQLKPAIG